LDTCQTKVAYLQIAIFVDENVAGFQVTVNDTRRMDIFQSTLCAVSHAHVPYIYISYQNLI
jgi:hypothetical protein